MPSPVPVLLRLSRLPVAPLRSSGSGRGEGSLGSAGCCSAIALSLVSDVLRFIVFFTPSQPNTPAALTATSGVSGSGVVGRLFGRDSTSGGLLSNPDRLLALLTLPRFSAFSPSVTSPSLSTVCGWAKTIRGVGLGPRDGSGDETDCAFEGTGGPSSACPCGTPRPRLKLFTLRTLRVCEESRDEPDAERLRRSSDGLSVELLAIGCRLDGFRGLEGVTTIPWGTAGRSLSSAGGSGGSGRSDTLDDDDSRGVASALEGKGGVLNEEGGEKASRSLAVLPKVRGENMFG